MGGDVTNSNCFVVTKVVLMTPGSRATSHFCAFNTPSGHSVSFRNTVTALEAEVGTPVCTPPRPLAAAAMAFWVENQVGSICYQLTLSRTSPQHQHCQGAYSLKVPMVLTLSIILMFLDKDVADTPRRQSSPSVSQSLADDVFLLLKHTDSPQASPAGPSQRSLRVDKSPLLPIPIPNPLVMTASPPAANDHLDELQELDSEGSSSDDENLAECTDIMASQVGFVAIKLIIRPISLSQKPR